MRLKDVILKAKKIANLEVSRKDISVNRRLRTDLSSYGFDIVDITGETNEDLSIGGTAPSLKQFLEKKYQMNLMVKSKSILSFPSGSSVHHARYSPHGPKEKRSAFCSLHEEDYNDIQTKDDCFFAVIFASPNTTLVFSKARLKSLIHKVKPAQPEKRGGRKPRWTFDIISKSDGKYFLEFRKGQLKDQGLDKESEITDCVNRWDYIKDIRERMWSFDREKTINDILRPNTEKELAIDRHLVDRILLLLKAGKHVILAGPPGVGKTDLAKRILETVGKKLIGNDGLESVASDEWGRYDLIGGLGFDTMNSDSKSKFQMGWISKAAVENKWLLIDEFNRASMNKAFAEMFLAIEYHRITLQPRESDAYGTGEPIEIPENFRMICTMNDFDKNLLLTELSYGLINRFAFVSVTADTDREQIVVEKRVKSLPGNNEAYDKCEAQINLYYTFINNVRTQRNIGVRTSIDIVTYLIAATRDNNNIEDNYKWGCLNDALCSYVLPQFDRLDRNTINAVLGYAKSYLTQEAFVPFKAELQQASENLENAAGWLTGKN